MLAIGETKLQLDDAVGGDEITFDGEAAGPGQKDDKTAKEVRRSLLTTLRNKFEAGKGDKADQGGTGPTMLEDVKEDGEVKEANTPARKKARGAVASQI